ncbi:MAG: DUF1489 domain-containing protein [Devosiaceae bacterium]|nr:DUF1489 domain-containing protein [Devosiaceae bacterium MH13]
MSLHLIKLCVGADSVEDHEAWIAAILAAKRARGEPVEQTHTTRMVPKRAEELLLGGSLYWVVKGQVLSRQKLVDIRPFKDEMGINRCHLVLDPELIRTRPQPRRPFQGWRYLKPEDAPADWDKVRGNGDDLPPEMRSDLAELGLL